MNGRIRRLVVLFGLGCVTWCLLARFVWMSTNLAQRQDALPVGGAAFAAYLLTVGYAIYYRAYWAKPRRVTGRRLGPMLRWFLTIGVVSAFGLTVGFGFPELMATYAGQLFVQTMTFGMVGVGLVFTVSGQSDRGTKAEASTSTSLDGSLQFESEASATLEQTPPSFFASALRVLAWQVYAVVGAAVLFAPAYGVMKGFEVYVDIPACETVCTEHGYQFESLVTGKSIYNCNCHGAAGRHTFHERAHVAGGAGLFGGVFDWLIRTVCVLGAVGASLTLVIFTIALGAKSPNGRLAKVYAACARLLMPSKAGAQSDSGAADGGSATHHRQRARSKRRGRS